MKGSPPAAAPRNPWRGERTLALPGNQPVLVKASLDSIARMMAVLKTDTLEGLNDRLAGRLPADLEACLAVLAGDETARETMVAVNGATGLTAVYVAIAGAISGLTPEEEDEAKKAEADRDRTLQAAAVRAILEAVGRSNASPSGNG